MPRPLAADYLQEDEEVLLQAGRHPLSVLDEILWATFLAAAAVTGVLVWVFGFQPRFWLPVGLPVVVVVGFAYLVFLLTRYFRVTTSLYTITSDRAYRAHGRFRFFLSQTTYDKVTDMHVSQSLFGRIFGFGTIRIETAGTGIALDGVHDPFGYKQRIESARRAFLETLLGERPERPPQRTETEVQVESEPLWTGRPCLPSFFGQILTAAAMTVVGIGLLVTGVALEPFMLIFAAAILLMAAATGLGAWVRYRFTRYHVEPRGVVVTSGWLTRRRVETTFEKVTDVTVYQSLLARLFDFGNITINTAGGSAAPVVFQGLRQPEAAKRVIDDARRQWEARH